MNQTTNKEIYRGTLNVGGHLSDGILVGWLRAEPTSNTEFHVYSKNTAEYLACEMHMIGFTDQIYGDTVLELLNKTEKSGKKFCFINQIGYWSSQIHHEFEYFITNTYSNEAVVGINEYDLLCGIALVNIDWWVSAGRPDPNTDEFYIQATKQGIRRWPNELTRDYKFQEIKINNMHPANPDGHQRIMERMHRQIFQTEIFFCANTEDFSMEPVHDGIVTDTIITVAGGLSAVLMAYSNNMPAGSTIHVVDTSPLAIRMSREIFENWDGANYADFIQSIIQADSSITERLRGVRQLSAIDDAIKKLPGFDEWFKSTFKTYKINYTQLDLMQYDSVKKLLMEVTGAVTDNDPDRIMILKAAQQKTRRVDINFSNVYHYAPSSFYVDYNTRRTMSVNLSRLVARLSALTSTTLRLNGGTIADYNELLEMFPWR